jgi:hypothetical protein
MWLLTVFGLVTRFIDYLCTHDSWLHFTDYWHTQTSVLSLLQSPIAVSWKRILTQELLTASLLISVYYSTYKIFSSLPDFQLSTLANVTDFSSNLRMQSRAVAYCRHPASTVTPVIEPRWDPWPYICSMSRRVAELGVLLGIWAPEKHNQCHCKSGLEGTNRSW